MALIEDGAPMVEPEGDPSEWDPWDDEYDDRYPTEEQISAQEEWDAIKKGAYEG